MKIRGVLFDLDGVLLKSMEQHLEAWQHAFGRYKKVITANDFYMLEGRGVKSVVEILTKKHNIDPGLKEKIMDDKIKYYNKRFRAEFYEGLFSLLDFLKNQKLEMAVVTGGFRDRVNQIVHHHFNGYFSAMVTSDDVENTKPYPEPYLKGATLLELRPDECIVIENAPMGIESGKKAGMFVIAVSTTLDEEYLYQADMIAENFADVEKYITSKFVANKSEDLEG